MGIALANGVYIARAAGHPRVVRRFITHVSKVERVTGGVLVGLAFGIIWVH